MKSLIRTAKTVEEAVKQAIKALNTDKENVSIEVIEEPKSGLFGLIGSKDAVVKVTVLEEKNKIMDLVDKAFSEEKESVKEETEVLEKIVEKTEKVLEEKLEEKEVQDEVNQEIKNLLKDILEGMEIEADVQITEEEASLKVEIVGASERDTSIIIGRRGETLDAIQYLLNIVNNKNKNEFVRVVLDISGYRKKREESLIRLANKTADRALKMRRNLRLEPMNPYERRIVHSALQDRAGITTVSEGEDPFRKVVIKVDRRKYN